MTPAEFRALREAMSLTQPELGDAMGLNTATVRRIETAAVEAVHPRDALAIERLALIAAAYEAALPYISPVQTADFGRQLRQHDALVAAIAAITKGNAND